MFYIGKRFESINELHEVKKSFEDTCFVELWKKDVRTLCAAKKSTPKRVANINPLLQYCSILLACKFSGKPRKKKQTEKKKQKVFAQNPFKIYLAASEDGNALEVLRVNLEHNHEISKDLYESLPRQRLLPGHVLEEVKSAIKLKANNKLLQQKIEQDTGKKVTLKDTSNIKYRTRLPLNRNDLDSVAEFLQKEGDSSVGIMVDEEKILKNFCIKTLIYGTCI